MRVVLNLRPKEWKGIDIQPSWRGRQHDGRKHRWLSRMSVLGLYRSKQSLVISGCRCCHTGTLVLGLDINRN